MVFDPAFMNTAVATSKITYVDGEKGELRYRGYRIEDLVANCSFLEVAFLLIYGELPTSKQFQDWENKVMTHTYIHENLISQMKTFRYDAHPMGMLISSVAALSTFYEEANPALKGPMLYKNQNLRNKQIFRILGKLPTIAACAYRHRIGRPYNNPVNHLSYTENFLYMMDRLSETDYRPHPKLAKALDVCFILHADHEMNCSTAAMRHVGSSLVDPYTAVACAAGALYGPLHGGANEGVLHMLEEIGHPSKIPQFLSDVKAKKRKLMGFGHRIYKNYDPRATILKQVAMEVFELCGKTPLYEIAVELENQALKDEYFVSRLLFPNVDFYSGLIYQAMGFPTDMFPVLFSIPRAAGWLAHWIEMLDDPDLKIFRPRQKYIGFSERSFIPIEERVEEPHTPNIPMYYSAYGVRRTVTQKWQEQENLKKSESKGDLELE
jgi:citrate synthase